MRASDCDILVVGAGPAGSSAAFAAARKGANVLLVERRQQVGVPVQCAEYIPAVLKGQLELKGDCVVQKIGSMHTLIPGQPVKKTVAPGFIIRRDVFDQDLASAARKAGAKIRCATKAAALLPNGNVILSPKNRPAFVVHPKVIIGADGPRSTVGRWAGSVNRHLLPAVQITLLLKAPMTHTEIYFDREITAGYGWLFPKGKMANVGIGMVRPSGGQPSIRKVLDNFIQRLKLDGKIDGAPVTLTAGWIPAEPVRNTVTGNILLVGDAAGHTHPITGAGIFTAVTCGRMAGKCAFAAVAANDVAILKDYDHGWQDLFGDTQARAHLRRKQMEAGWSRFDKIVKQCWVAYREYYDESVY
ncbi:geranylgeranyl reductase family protein [Desulfotignum phosphitoxidans]|uniref:Digeranylgeranylglycerophospholipid reductase n=1 Tax=Desulfotignum phosphitoxidans DSM 13687 TaxID=1286635 RepID=S0G2B3_9BACT|nr:NAD(P)/FAD-dependent oxidoreductase [Desulfotignum phosphitoxidans]EMS81488.1 digeranylgeranylglycerophospholipid reductase [Desulfotignum phosphitoxidans DSM 13687]